MNVTRRRSSGVAGASAAAVLLASLSATATRAAPATFAPGDVLVDNSVGNVQQYAPDGTLKQTFAAGGSQYEGAAVTAAGTGGLLATGFITGTGTVTGNLALFHPDGSLAATFATAGLQNPGDVSVFPDGTLAVADRAAPAVRLYTQAGTAVRTLTAAGMTHPFGSAVAADGTLWVTDPIDDALFHLTESGQLLATVPLAYGPGDAVVSPVDASLYVTDNNSNVLHHLSAAGADLGSFATAVFSASNSFRGVGLAPDGTLYVAGFGSASVYHYGPTGTPLGRFPLQPATGNPIFLTVVPAAVPEPTVATATIAAVAAGLLGRRRR